MGTWQISGFAMKQHEFTLILDKDPSEEEAELLYAKFDDGTICTSEGIAQVEFCRESSSLEDAIRSAIRDVESLRLRVERVEIERQTVTT